MAKLCILRNPKVYKRLYRRICEHAMKEIPFASKESEKSSHAQCAHMAQARAMQAFPCNTPSHTRAHDGRGTGGRRLWRFMKREALSGIPLALCASVCLCV